jgi:hypothetical protein
MALEQGSPGWFAKGGSDLAAGRADTTEAKGVVDEARTLLFHGAKPNDVRKMLIARGAGKAAAVIVGRAAMAEWHAVVKAASTDVEAAQVETPNVARARALAMEITRADPSGQDFETKLAGHGASAALATYLANDPEILETARHTGWALLIGSAVFLLFVTVLSGGTALPIVAVVVIALVAGRGLGGITRKARPLAKPRRP